MSPLGRRVARFNLRVTNRLTDPAARLLPGFGVVLHTGRRSGRQLRTPVNVFRVGGRYVFALTYGTRAEWVRNVQAAAGCELVTRGRRLSLRAPEVVHDRTRRLVPAPIRPILGALGVDDFLVLRQG